MKAERPHESDADLNRRVAAEMSEHDARSKRVRKHVKVLEDRVVSGPPGRLTCGDSFFLEGVIWSFARAKENGFLPLYTKKQKPDDTQLLGSCLEVLNPLDL